MECRYPRVNEVSQDTLIRIELQFELPSTNTPAFLVYLTPSPGFLEPSLLFCLQSVKGSSNSGFVAAQAKSAPANTVVLRTAEPSSVAELMKVLYRGEEILLTIKYDEWDSICLRLPNDNGVANLRTELTEQGDARTEDQASPDARVQNWFESDTASTIEDDTYAAQEEPEPAPSPLHEREDSEKSRQEDEVFQEGDQVTVWRWGKGRILSLDNWTLNDKRAVILEIESEDTHLPLYLPLREASAFGLRRTDDANVDKLDLPVRAEQEDWNVTMQGFKAGGLVEHPRHGIGRIQMVSAEEVAGIEPPILLIAFLEKKAMQCMSVADVVASGVTKFSIFETDVDSDPLASSESLTANPYPRLTNERSG